MSKNAIYGILAIILVPVGALIEDQGAYGHGIAGAWLVICGLSCGLEWLRARRSGQ
jgi:hypothetical protein